MRIAFETLATNWVPGDDNHASDVIVFDRASGRAERASCALDGGSPTGLSHFASISGDGRRVAFASQADNLVEHDRNAASDVFVRDLERQQTVRVSRGLNGADADGPSFAPRISGDGRFVVFQSAATNLVEDDGNNVADVFLFEIESGRTELVSVRSDGRQADLASSEASVSGDGRYVAFVSLAANLVPADQNDRPDIFIRDRSAARTWRVSVSADGREADNFSSAPRLSPDGRHIVFESWAGNLVSGDTNGGPDVFLAAIDGSGLRRISVGPGEVEGDGHARLPDVSSDAACITFFSVAANLVPGDSELIGDVYIRNPPSGEVRRISQSREGDGGDADSDQPAVSADGRWVVFASKAKNLLAGDANKKVDVFVYDVQTGTLERLVPQSR